jgi:hypothetical protein
MNLSPQDRQGIIAQIEVIDNYYTKIEGLLGILDSHKDLCDLQVDFLYIKRDIKNKIKYINDKIYLNIYSELVLNRINQFNKLTIDYGRDTTDYDTVFYKIKSLIH